MSLIQQNSSQILKNQYHQYLVKNGEPELSKLSSSCSRTPPHGHRDHSEHNEDHHSHYDNGRNNRRWDKWHWSSRSSRRRTTSRRASSQDNSRLQKTDITKTNLLTTNLSESIHQGDIGATSKLLGTKRLKLITKPSQKVVGPAKLKCSCLISVGQIGGRGQLRAKSVKLAPNNRKLIKEILNCRVTLAKKLLLTNSNKVDRLTSRLILLTNKRPHLMSPLKIHNISSKAILHTSCQNRAITSILIKPSPVRVKLRLVRGQTIIIISKKPLLLSSGSLLWDHRLSRSQRRRRARKLAREKIPKMKSTHVQMHARNPVTIVCAVEEHRTSQH
jgi:hypothetical protein